MAAANTSAPMFGPVIGATSLAQERLTFIDNLRWVLIVLVVSMHAAVTYSHLGSWYFMEEPKPGKLGTILFAYYQMGLQAFFMGLLFLLAGYFVPSAFDRKGAARFLYDRFLRLGIPALFYMLAIHPLVAYWLLRGHNKVAQPFGTAYLGYLQSLRFLGGSGPESYFCLGICLGLIVLFREKFNRQGPFAKWMTDNCFAVYLFHAPVLIAVTLAMQPLAAPKPVKFLVATVLGTAVTYVASHWIFRQTPLLRRVL